MCHLEAEVNVEAALVVYCPKPKHAARYRDMLNAEGLSLVLRPFIFTPHDVPLVVDVELAEANPALAVFSALCHGGDANIDTVFPALARVLQALGPANAILYYDIVLAGLPSAPRARWEAYMTTTVGSEFRSELLRESYARGKAQGEARGEGQAVLTVLETRGVPVPEAIREQILTCTDLAQLDIWLRRAVTATSAKDVIRKSR